jgi:hypothetical protein
MASLPGDDSEPPFTFGFTLLDRAVIAMSGATPNIHP